MCNVTYFRVCLVFLFFSMHSFDSILCCLFKNVGWKWTTKKSIRCTDTNSRNFSILVIWTNVWSGKRIWSISKMKCIHIEISANWILEIHRSWLIQPKILKDPISHTHFIFQARNEATAPIAYCFRLVTMKILNLY